MSEPEAETRPPHALEPAPPAPDDAGDAQQQPSELPAATNVPGEAPPAEPEPDTAPEDYEPVVTRLPEALQVEREAAEAAAPSAELEE